MSEMITEQTPAAPDRAAIRAKLDATSAEYRGLVSAIADGDWKSRSGNPGWTRGQLAWHVAASGDFIAGQIDSARKGKGLNPPSFTLPLIFKLSEVRVRWKSRKATRESVFADFDTGVARMCRLLDSLRDEEFAMSATNFGQTQTIAELFHVPLEHLAEHGPDMARNG